MQPEMLLYLVINLLGCVSYLIVSLTLIRLFKAKLIPKSKPLIIGMGFSFAFSFLYFTSGLIVYFQHKNPQGSLFECALLMPVLFFFIFHKQLLPLNSNAQSVNARFNQLKDEFLTVASHELRTPLSIISGFAEILMREKLGPLNDEQKRRVRKILMQGQRLNRIVDELLDLSRIRSGKISVKKEIFDIIPVLKACYEDHVVICDQQNIQFQEKIPDTLPDVLGDLDRVTQIIVNLLNNAIKYTPTGGKILLMAEHDKEHSRIRINITDTGIGIDSSEQELIFEEFYRSNDPTSRKHAGSGLGLAIVKQLAESQDGAVSVYSAGLGNGSTFTFSLPVASGLTDH